jgi:NAD(P)-dependent dehydrogenase (short-subunit alcohol dehydrogenase family)
MNGMKLGALLAAGGLGAWWLLRRRTRFEYRDRTVLITGGSRGLGLVMAREAAKLGARVAICARDEDELRRAVDDLARYGGEVAAYACDVTDAGQVQHLVHMVEERFGQIDVLINNAGIISVGPMSTMTRADYEEAMAVNFWGAFNTVEAVLPAMRRRADGRIVNISSIGGKVSVPHLLPYCASKFALTGFSEGLRAELSDDGIVVTTVCPWLMRTGSPRNAEFKGHHRIEYAWFSIGDSLPLLTLSAESAARKILAACRKGSAEVVLDWPAWLAVRAQAFCPETFAGLLALMNRIMPGAEGMGKETHLGKESESWASPSPLTALTERAARRNNELEPEEVKA